MQNSCSCDARLRLQNSARIPHRPRTLGTSSLRPGHSRPRYEYTTLYIYRTIQRSIVDYFYFLLLAGDWFVATATLLRV